MRILNILIFCLLLFSCKNEKRKDKYFEALAVKNIEILDLLTLRALQSWDYDQRGDFWFKFLNEDRFYSCAYHFSIDTPRLIINRPTRFLQEFGSNLNIDTAYNQIILVKIKDTLLKLLATNRFGKDILLQNELSFKKTFPHKDPFLFFDTLTQLKNKLQVIGIIHENDLGGFIQFYFKDGQHILTYLPDTLMNSDNFNKFWKTEFSKGKKLAPNWNFRKLEAPIGGG
jgi:hypothetical protein